MKEDSIHRIAYAYGLPGSQLSIVATGRTSYVFEYMADERPLILRAVEEKGDIFSRTCAETHFVSYLADNGANVARPVSSAGGVLNEIVEVTEGPFVVTAWERASGKPVTLDDWTPVVWEAMGEELGRMHRLSKDYSPPQGRHRPHWHEAAIMDVSRYLPKGHKTLQRKASELIARLQELPADNDQYGLIHSDPNRGNICAVGGRVTFYDFEDCEYHWFVNDLAVALYFAVEDSFTGRDVRSYVHDFMRALLNGYRRQHHLDAFWLQKISVFHQLRDLLTVLYFYANGGNTLGEHEIARATRSRINLELGRPYLPLELQLVIDQ